ncbi:MAG: hypothetical protein O2955_08610 [Planctomycetota bacterium]|nr:hypothetical protein [Planctomycetota bacterium]MDA1212566.1 hypothetical protein [Planctomycetota bacterium]
MSSQRKTSFRLKNIPLVRTRQLISHSTILILSVFLLVLTAVQNGGAGRSNLVALVP